MLAVVLFDKVLYPSIGVRYLFLTYSVMIEVKVFFFENGLLLLTPFTLKGTGFASSRG